MLRNALAIAAIGGIGSFSGTALAAVSDAEFQSLQQQLNQMADVLENRAAETQSGHGSAGSTTVGGYGELHYNNTDSSNEIDMHRFVIFFGHDFNERIRFWSELEVEHAQVTADGGEVSIEQAFIEFDLNANHAVRAGIILVPVGIINETHEPPTFYGVERNNVEKYIIPTTWREGGVSLTGRFGNAVSYDLAMHSGLEISASGNYAVRSGRNAVREAPAQDPAYTARIKWTGVAGLELGGAIQYQRDISQGTDATAGAATLLETHAIWQAGATTLRALYASWNLDGTGPAAAGADEQTGWYIEPSYKLNSAFGVFARQSSWDNRPNSGSNTENTQTDFGFNYWPHEDVVVKADYQLRDKAGTDDDGFNLGIGYQF